MSGEGAALAPLRIGILGTRGIPNRYGGFEECAEQIGVRLARSGHDVVVYTTRHHEFRGPTWKGVRLVHCGDPVRVLGSASQFVYDLACLRDARRRDFDILLQLGYTSSSIWHRQWPRTCRHVVNMDGMEWTRAKYGWLTRRFLRRAERLAAVHADALVADSPPIRCHIADRYGRDSTCIPYGSVMPFATDPSRLDTLGLSSDGYNLVVARMEPENQVGLIVEASLESGTGTPLIVVGSTANRYGRALSRKADGARVRFVGPIYDRTLLDTLRRHARLYVHGHSAGGTNPSLLDAMACRAVIVAHDNVFNRAVLQEDGIYFKDKDGLADVLRRPPARLGWSGALERNADRIRHVFNWDVVAGAYERLFRDVVRGERDACR